MARSPERRLRTRPVELVLLAAGIAVFVGVVVLIATRDGTVALVFTGAAFIVALLMFAMLALAESSDHRTRPVAGSDATAEAPTATPIESPRAASGDTQRPAPSDRQDEERDPPSASEPPPASGPPPVSGPPASGPPRT